MLSLRRHHAERLKAKRKANAHAGVAALNTPAACSCWMCGNPRKYFNQPTIQERRFYQGV